MNISLRRHGGGFAGKAGDVLYEIDTDGLPGASREELLALVAAANLSARPIRSVLTHGQSQAALYSLQTSSAGHQQTLEFQLEAVDEPLRRLVDWLQDEIKPVSAFKPG